MGQDDVKIRVVPRSNERPKKAAGPVPAASMPRHWIIAIGGAVSLGLWLSILWLPPRAAEPTTRVLSSHDVSVADAQTRIGSSIHRYMTDSMIRQDMMRMQRELENAEIKDRLEGGLLLADGSVPAGPLMDHDKSSERVFQDLDVNSRSYSDRTPDERINSRLASRKWLNEQERAERINFVRNFIRSAYDRGYEVQLNENLVVVGVRRIRKDRMVTIDQIMDRMAKQGF